MYCRNCGKEMRDTDKFCSHCGAPADSVPSKAEIEITTREVTAKDIENLRTQIEEEEHEPIDIVAGPVLNGFLFAWGFFSLTLLESYISQMLGIYSGPIETFDLFDVMIFGPTLYCIVKLIYNMWTKLHRICIRGFIYMIPKFPFNFLASLFFVWGFLLEITVIFSFAAGLFIEIACFFGDLGSTWVDYQKKPNGSLRFFKPRIHK